MLNPSSLETQKKCRVVRYHSTPWISTDLKIEHPHSTNFRQSKQIIIFYQKKSKSTITNNKRTNISNPNKTQIRILLHCLGSSHKRKHKLARKGKRRAVIHATDIITPAEMLNTMNWQTLQERRLRTRLMMFHKVINENIAIPTHNILHQSQSMTRSSRKDSYRQIQCNKDSHKCSFFCQTIKDWTHKLSPDIAKNTTTESFKGALTHDVLLDTYPHLK